MSPSPEPVRPVRAAAAVFLLALPVLAAKGAWEADRANGWSEIGYRWLALDQAARAFPWKPAAAAALVVLLAGALLRRSRPGGAARLGAPLRLLGRTSVLLTAAVLAFGVPRLAARWTRPRPVAGAPNLLFVLVDTWRADHAGFLGYGRDVSPGLDALAARGVVFEHATAHTGWTKPSVATLLTGLLPSRHRAISQPVRDFPVRGTSLPPRVTTLVETFRAAGYETAMWSNNPNILPVRGFDQGAGLFVDYFHDDRRTPEFDPGRAERMVPDVERWLFEERDESRPFCAYVHVMDAHYPYVAPPPFRGTFDHSGLDFQLTGPVIDDFLRGQRSIADVTPEMRQRIVDIYDEELLYVDHYVAPFVERVLAAFPDTIVVLVGDHGEEFLEHGQFGHAHTLYQELTHVPLVLLGPMILPGRVATQVRLMDVQPTLLELAGLGQLAPPGVQGSSLLPVLIGAETADRLAPLETGGDERPPWHWRGLSDGRREVLRREPDLPTRLPVPELAPGERDEPRPAWHFFDLVADPFEQHDVYDERRDEAQALFEVLLLQGWFLAPEEILRLRAGPAGETDEDDLEALRALGYAGAEG